MIRRLITFGFMLVVSGCATSPSPSPAASESPSPKPATPCAVNVQEGRLASDRLVDVRVDLTPALDAATFIFGPPAGPAGRAHGNVEEAHPPFTQGASGLPLDVPGARVVRLRFDGLVLYDESGTPTYTGPPVFLSTNGRGIRSVVQEEAFEGVMSWLIGFDGPGCVTLSGDPGGRQIVVSVAHG